MVNELFRCGVKRDNAEDLVFIDYASSGEDWENSDDKISVCLEVKDK